MKEGADRKGDSPVADSENSEKERQLREKACACSTRKIVLGDPFDERAGGRR